jgi:hypothetical protein
MDEDGVRELIGDISRQGERLSAPASGAEIRARSGPGLTDGAPRRRLSAGRRSLGRIAGIAALIVVIVPVIAVVVFVAIPASNHKQRSASPTTTSPRPLKSPQQLAVGSAVENTDSIGNFDLSFTLSGQSNVTGSGPVNLTPTIAMNMNGVEGVSLWFGPDNAWEGGLGGAGGSYTEYTIPAFSSFAENFVGQKEGALATFGFSSPTGLFDISQTSIGPTTEIGKAVVDGVETTEYQVSIDPNTLLQAPGITSGESTAIASAIGILGGAPITDDVYVNSSNEIARTVSSVDHMTLQVDLSNFGSAGTVSLPPQQSEIDTRTGPPTDVTTPVTVLPSSSRTLPPSETTTT